MRVERDFIQNSEGERIAAAVHYPKEDPEGSVLLQHGFFSNKGGSWERRADHLAERGFRAVRFDRRGYGESDGNFNEFNLSTGIEDSVTILDFLEEGGERNFAILGSSFGGLIAIHVAATDSRVDAIVLRSPVTYTESVFAELREGVMMGGRVKLEEMPGEYIDGSFFSDLNSHNIDAAARKIRSPTLIFHGTGDDVVPIGDSRRFYRKLEAEKEMIEVEGGAHVFSEEQDRTVLRRSAQWFSRSFY